MVKRCNFHNFANEFCVFNFVKSETWVIKILARTQDNCFEMTFGQVIINLYGKTQ